jgi:L-threonylcarbamoyladenylate synthase
MTGPQVVRPRGLRQVATALEAGHVVAVPGDGGYQLVGRLDHAAALAALRRTTPAPGTIGTMVGRRRQAVQLAAAWSKETSMVTDRMWPGPLTVIVAAARNASPAGGDDVGSGGVAEAVVHLGMPAWRPLRVLCRRSGPLTVAPLWGADGEPLFTAADVVASLLDAPNQAEGVSLVLDGGGYRGAGTTVVDCTVSPPEVRRVGGLPESYVEAALLMGARKRSWFARRSRATPPA